MSTRRGFLAGIAGAVAAIGGTSAQEATPRRAPPVEDAPKLPDDVIRTYEVGETVWGDRYTVIIENRAITDNDVNAIAEQFGRAITEGIDLHYEGRR